MADNTHLTEISREIGRLKDIPEQVKKLSDALDLRDQRIKKLMESIVVKTQDQETRFQTIETELQKMIRPPETSGSNQPFQVRNIKLDFPRFDGSNVLHWIFRAEQFFNYYNTPDEQRLTIASIHLDKEVVPWYQTQVRTNPFHSWIDFTRALETEFGPSPYECPRSDLFKL